MHLVEGLSQQQQAGAGVGGGGGNAHEPAGAWLHDQPPHIAQQGSPQILDVQRLCISMGLSALQAIRQLHCRGA